MWKNDWPRDSYNFYQSESQRIIYADSKQQYTFIQLINYWLSVIYTFVFYIYTISKSSTQSKSVITPFSMKNPTLFSNLFYLVVFQFFLAKAPVFKRFQIISPLFLQTNININTNQSFHTLLFSENAIAICYHSDKIN